MYKVLRNQSNFKKTPLLQVIWHNLTSLLSIKSSSGLLPVQGNLTQFNLWGKLKLRIHHGEEEFDAWAVTQEDT